MNQAAQDKAGRLLDIDRAKGFGIALVVWGHLFKVDTYDQPYWYQVSKIFVYQFHMPLFMYLSGFVFFITASHIKFFHNPGRFVAKRFDRLMVPFIIFGLLILFGKFAAASFIAVDDPVNGIVEGAMSVITNSPTNPTISIWYLLVLFIYCLVTPLIWRASGGRISVLVALGLLGWIMPLPEDYYIKRIAIFFLFFVMGGIAALHKDIILPAFRRWWLPSVLIFGVFCYIFYGSGYSRLFCGLASIPAIHGIFLQSWWKKDRIFVTLGYYSMAIYLLNTIFIGVAKVMYARLIPYDGMLFFAFAIVVFLVAVVGPMVVKAMLDRVKVMRPVARYLA